ncbi:transcriptional regulator [Enterobacter sp. MF024]|uniref:transcriptional regulator n=1 Tax=Enterobacter sp. MF024 TaxID=2555644 RepID=UPI0011061C1B|nr:transcriptional regulator [Enterobacter sp. MF024]TLU69569.1 transcriptional regulator [Enterobacter sp. MF024]
MSLRKRLFLIINTENLTIKDFAGICSIPLKTLENFMNRRVDALPDIELLKITGHPRFNKYTLWMMTNKTALSSGQIDPAIFPLCPDEQFINCCT